MGYLPDCCSINYCGLKHLKKESLLNCEFDQVKYPDPYLICTYCFQGKKPIIFLYIRQQKNYYHESVIMYFFCSLFI